MENRIFLQIRQIFFMDEIEKPFKKWYRKKRLPKKDHPQVNHLIQTMLFQKKFHHNAK